MNAMLEILFTAGQAASALLLVYGSFLTLAPNLMIAPAGEATSQAHA